MFGDTIYLGKFRRLTEYQIYAPDSIKLASPFQKGTLKIYAAESNVILHMFSNLPLQMNFVRKKVGFHG